MPKAGTKFKGNYRYELNEKSRRYNSRFSAKFTTHQKAAVRARLAQGDAEGVEAGNVAPTVRESFWRRVKREWAALQAHIRDWENRQELRAAASIERDALAFTASPPMTPAQSARFKAEAELQRETLEWRRKTGRNMFTGEHLSGMPIDTFNEFPDGNPFEEEGEGKLKWGRQPLSVEEGRPFDPKVFDADGIYIGKRRRREKGEPKPDPRRDEHGRDARGWLPDNTHCDTGFIFGPDNKSKYGYKRGEYFREVILKGLTPEEAAAHRTDAEQHERVLAADALEREWAARYAV